MGTHAITRVKENGQVILALYRQYDGYTGGHGKELAEFLVGKPLTNGIGDYDKPSFNGMGCLAAQLVAHFKTGVGGFYIYPTDAEDEEYNYTIEMNRAPSTFGPPGNLWIRAEKFQGSPEEFLEYINSGRYKKDEEEEE